MNYFISYDIIVVKRISLLRILGWKMTYFQREFILIFEKFGKDDFECKLMKNGK